MKAKQVS